MKIISFLSLASLLLRSHVLFGQTSVYHSFPDTNAVWNIHSTEPCGLFFDTWEHYYSYVFSGDTTIGIKNYHKLNVPVSVIYSNGGCSIAGTWVLPGHFAGSVRQDVSAKKVFYVAPADSVEQILYDFTMQVGDTVKGFFAPMPGLTDSVHSIDSILIGSNYRKRWLVDPCYQIYIIEGIGSTYGLIERFPGCITDASDFEITCFSQNGTTLYPNTATSCALISAIPGQEKKTASVIVAPNPFHQTASITINSRLPINNWQLNLYDAFGRMALQQIIHQNTTVISRQFLPDGMYFFRLTTGDGQQLITDGKLVVE